MCNVRIKLIRAEKEDENIKLIETPDFKSLFLINYLFLNL